MSKKNQKYPSIQSIIGAGCHFQGALSCTHSVKIDGCVLGGQIKIDGVLIIGQTAQINAPIECQKLIVYGKVNANAKAQYIHLCEGSVFTGEAQAQMALYVAKTAVYTPDANDSESSSSETIPTQIVEKPTEPLPDPDLNPSTAEQMDHASDPDPSPDPLPSEEDNTHPPPADPIQKKSPDTHPKE